MAKADIPGLPVELMDRPGVVMSEPPRELMPKINQSITEAVREIGQGKSGIFTVWIDTEAGVNAATAVKIGGGVSVIGYVGSKWGEPLSAGAALRWEF